MITLTTPFANKQYCFDKYYESIIALDYPKDQLFVIWYDNSNDMRFHRLLCEKIKVFPYHKIVTDKTDRHTIENTTEWIDISRRVSQVYKAISLLVPDNEYMFNVEDDITIPNNALKKLLKVFDESPKIGTAIGFANSRRFLNHDGVIPNVWRFKQKRTFGDRDSSKEIQTVTERFYEVPAFGIEIVGTGHLGCWLTKTKVLKEVGFSWAGYGLHANDIVWGRRLKEAGYYFVVDWSVKCKHWYKENNEVKYC